MPIRYLLLSCLLISACVQNTQDELAQDSQLPVEIQDCAVCPVMIEVPAGSFLMGTAEADSLIDPRTGKPAKNDVPQHQVTIGTPFAIGKFEITTSQFGDFVSASGYQPEAPCMEFSPPESFTISADFNWNDTGFPQTNDAPVGCVSFFDAQAYTAWLTTISGNTYRLPTEAEWEYAARAGSTTPFYWGTDTAVACDYANVRSAGAFTISTRQAEADVSPGFPCDDGFALSAPVGSFMPNAFGLYDMQGNAWEWVADCNHKNYAGAPTDGSAWLDDRGCQFGVIRSGSYLNLVERSSTTVRAGRPREGRATNMGFRVVRVTTEAAQQAATASAAWGAAAAAPTDDPGAILFNNNCAACHVRRDDYRGVYGTSQAAVEATIRDGGNNIMSMPAFGETLTTAEISTLAAYVRSQNDWD